MTGQLSVPQIVNPQRLVNTAIGLLNAIPSSVISLVARIGIASIFWRSGQTIVDGWQITDSARYLFREEYALPLLNPEFAANMAAFAERLFPVILIIGLASRLSATALLIMTLTIQLFVYPVSWPDHFTWAAALIFIMARGPGPLSLDQLIRRRHSF